LASGTPANVLFKLDRVERLDMTRVMIELPGPGISGVTLGADL
jgi:hypothetical protein